MKRVSVMMAVLLEVPDDFDELDNLGVLVSPEHFRIYIGSEGGAMTLSGARVVSCSADHACFVATPPPKTPTSGLYLFLMNDTGALVEVPFSCTSEEWQENYHRFFAMFGKGTRMSPEDVRAAQLYEDQRIDGIYYREGTANSQGAWFNVYQLPGDHENRVLYAIDKLKRDRDVVRMHKVKVSKLVDFTWEGSK